MGGLMPSGESVEPLRFADDDDPDDLGGFSRGKRSYDDDDDEDGGWAINEDHSDRLWDSAEDADDDEEADSDATVVSEGEEDEEDEEEDLFGGGAPRGRRVRKEAGVDSHRRWARESWQRCRRQRERQLGLW